MELGLRLVVETFKRGFGELAGDIDRLRADVAKVATSDDVERAVARTATAADIEDLTMAALQPLRNGLEELSERVGTTPASLRDAVDRLVDGIDAAQAIVDQATRPETQSPNGRSGDIPGEGSPEPDAQAIEGQASAPENRGLDPAPDPASIWGGEDGTDPALQAASLGPRDHRKRSPVRRRLEKSWPGRTYSQWKWRRT